MPAAVHHEAHLLRRHPRRVDAGGDGAAAPSTTSAERRSATAAPAAGRRRPAPGRRRRRAAPARSRGTARSPRRPARATPRRSRPPAPRARARITASRSASAKASSWSWVTRSAVVPAALQDLAQVAGQPLAQRRVERGQRLVEQDQPRLDGERPGQRDPLPLAARTACRAAGRRSPRRPTRSSSSRTRAATRADGVRRSRRAYATLRATVRWAKSWPSWNISAKPRLWVGVPARSAPSHEIEPGRQRLEPGDGAQQGRLAAARGAEHGEHLPGGEVERHVVDGDGVAVADGDVGELEQHRQNAPTPGTRSRSTASITTAVVAARTTEAASAMP